MKIGKQELKALIQLSHTPAIGPMRVRALVSHFQSAEAVLNASLTELCKVSGIQRSLAQKIHDNIDDDFARKQIISLERTGSKMITFWNDDFPSLLKNTHIPPTLIYTQGKILSADKNTIAIVGTRIPTQYGKMVTERLTTELVSKGITIVSGLARGIDTVAHRTALQQGGRTIAVLGSGLDVIYPAENRELAKDITEKGLLISEFAFGTKPDAPNFPRRNRIISGLSLGVIVIEAGHESGAMITANFALNQGRDVFAVPGNIMSPKSAGPHQLIREGAKLVANADDVIEELSAQLDLFSNQATDRKENLHLEKASMEVYNELSYEPLQIDILNGKLKLPVPQLMAILLELEFSNLVKQLPGKYFLKT